jgi:ketosteroid isomerase-like protein
MNRNHVQCYIDAFEHLTPSTLQALEDCFAERAHFVDPFNDVRGRSSIRRVFEHMFASCEDPRFEVEECLGDDSLVYLRWHFSFGKAASRRRIQGVSRVQFTSDGLVSEHLDYWDSASQLYEEIPVLGNLFRVLRHRLTAPQGGDRDSNISFSVTSNRNPT